MAQQPDLSQMRTENGPSPHDGYVEGFGLQASDISSPSAPGSFLDSLDISRSYLQSSIGYSTNPTHVSDVVFGSDKRSPFGDRSPRETGNGMTFNWLHNGMLSPGFSGHQLQSIDPQLLLCDQGLGEPTGLLPLSQNASMSAAINAGLDTASCQSSQMIYPNDFDTALEETATALGVKNSGPGPLSYLVLWSLLNPGLVPSAKELKCLEHLAQVPAKQIMTWLKKHTSANSKRQIDALQGSQEREYRSKCLNSRQRKTQSGEPRLYECTYRCGQTFSRHRKGDWERHERINFEEWVCSVCDHVLSRKEHLQKHLKAVHNIEGTKLESQKRQLPDNVDRPCGFCFEPFSTWVAWLAHVAAHFEGSIGGRKRKMSEWKEQMILASSSAPWTKRSTSHGGVTGDDEDEDDHSDGDNGEGGDGNNRGSNALSSSYALDIFRAPQPPLGAPDSDGHWTNAAKIAIPRLKKTVETALNPTRSSGRHRVSHACEPCRQRKVNCSGERPVCPHFQDFKIACFYADGPGQGHISRYGLGFPQTIFDGHSKDAKSQTTANLLGAPSLRHTGSTNIASDDTQEILQSFAALDISTITHRSTSVAYSQATNSAEFPTDVNMEPHVSSDPRGFRGRAGTSARHTQCGPP